MLVCVQTASTRGCCQTSGRRFSLTSFSTVGPKPRSILGSCLSHHSQSWCLCADGNPLYHTSPSNSTPYPSVIAMNNTQARKGFVSYAIAAMRHFKGRGVVWELW